MKQFFAFITGVFAFMFAEAAWCAPDYYRYGDISRPEELLWIGLTLMLVIISTIIWISYQND